MSSQQDFLSTYWPLAEDISAETGGRLSPSVVIAQIAQETGWGQHVQGNNIFGIQQHGQDASYPSVQAAAQAYLQLIRSHYPGALSAGTPEAQINAIAGGGYGGTDPQYGQHVLALENEIRGLHGQPTNGFFQKWGITPETPTETPTEAPTAPPQTGAPDFYTQWGIQASGAPVAPTAPTETASAAPSSAAPVDPVEAAEIGGVPWLGTPEADDAIDAGMRRAGADVLALPVEGLNWVTNKLGYPIPALQRWAANIPAERAAYNSQYGSNPLATGARLVGDIGLTALPAGAVGRLVGAPIEATLGTSIPARIATSALSGAGAGATANLLTAGASDQSLGRDLLNGVAFGGALGAATPVASGVLNYGRNALSTMGRFVSPTQGATNSLANDVLHQFTGGPVPLNTSPLVAGSIPTFPDASGNTGAARLMASLQRSDPVFDEAVKQRLAQNASARNAAVQGTTGTDQDLQNAINARAVITPQGVFANKTATNPQPVIRTIDSILQGPGGGRTAVSSTLNDIRAKLADPRATDPEYLYETVRKEIGDKLDKANLMDPAGRQAASQLLQVRDEVDNAIEAGAPGFGQYRSDYSTASQPIDSMKYLQGLNLTDSQGNVTLAKVDSALKDLNKKTSAGVSGVNDAQSVTAQQRQALENVRDDLLRGKGVNLTQPIGAATAQNLATDLLLNRALGPLAPVAKIFNPQIWGPALGAIAHGGGGVAGPLEGMGLGYAAGNALSNGAKLASAYRNQAVTDRLKDIMLNPSLYSPPTSMPVNPLRYLKPYVVPGAVVANRNLSSSP